MGTQAKVANQLLQLAVAEGHDYTASLVAAHLTAKEVDAVADAEELVDRLRTRIRAEKLSNFLMGILASRSKAE